LAKVVYFTAKKRRDESGRRNSLDVKNRHLGGELHFVKFQTRNLEACIQFILDKGLHIGDGGQQYKKVLVTGGGAIKYEELFKKRLGITFAKEDEMYCLIAGLNFLLKSISYESYTFSPIPDDPNPRAFVPVGDSPFPYLLVQIGSGVSVLKVDGDEAFERIDGTSLGGGTFWGLCSLLTGFTEFDDMLELAAKGENTNVDLTVGDIYGTDYAHIGLKADVLASSFGKVQYNLNGPKAARSDIQPEDVAMSLLKMISNNIAQIAYLNAMRYNIKTIYFGGFFIRDHPATMAKISYGVNYWSKGTMQALFLLHEGYLGALGAFLKNEEYEQVFDTSPCGSPVDSDWVQKLTDELRSTFTFPGGK